MCSKEINEQIKLAIEMGEVEFDDQASIVISDQSIFNDFMLVEDKEDLVKVKLKDITYIESLSKKVIVHTIDHRYRTTDPLYLLESKLYPHGFLRVHQSYIVNLDHIQRIKATFNTKFILYLSHQQQIEVSRSYYYKFKESLNF